jgi:GxxExxY protein
MGRFCDERIYQEELARRCRDAGFQVEREVNLQVSHRDFFKSYYLDMLINHGGLYELKAVETINKSHEKQVINYLLLAGLRHGKLVNLRPASVESRFVSTSLCRESRADFRLIVEEFEEATDSDQLLRKTLCALLDDWGAFLDANLYRAALLHLIDGPKAGFQPVEIAVDGFLVGSQRMCVLDDETAWHLSAARIHLPSYETHLFRLFNHTRFKRVHWINFDQRKITLKTLKK